MDVGVQQGADMKAKLYLVVIGSSLGLFFGNAQAQDAKAGEDAVKKSGCLKCHSVSADKDGPSFKTTAAKYKGKADGAATVQGELKSGMMKVDGKDVKHAAFKGSDADLKNVVAYILSR
jgi:cytochrome c